MFESVKGFWWEVLETYEPTMKDRERGEHVVRVHGESLERMQLLKVTPIAS